MSVLTFLGSNKRRIAKSPSKAADIRRWSSTENLSADWDNRAELAAEWIPKDSVILDVGCGKMAVEKFTAPSEYLPVDIVSRDNRTIVLDLNKQSIPVEILDRVKFATMLGVLEYLENPAELLTTLASNGINAVCSYQLADFSTPSVRSENGWFNSYSALEFTSLLQKCGFRIVESKSMDTQGLYLLAPSPIVDKNLNRGESMSASAKNTKPRLVLSGFFGRGNAGDEAVLQAEYEHLSKDFEIVISVAQHGAHEGFWNWYPYNQCQIIGHENLSIFEEQDVVGLHVGGGNLPIGFNASQIVAALAAGKQVQSSGVDIGTTFELAQNHNPAMLANYFSWTKPWIRSKTGCEIAKQNSESVRHGADWALGLRADCAKDVANEDCLLVLREFPKSRLTKEIQSNLSSLVQTLRNNFGAPTLLPFCPEDERFVNELESVMDLKRQVHWWNPARIKQYISKAKIVVSVGRFHPIVFAACTKTPAYFCEWGLPRVGTPDDFYLTPKAERICHETGIEYYPNLVSFTEDLRIKTKSPEAKGFDSLYLSRFELMKKEVTGGYLEAARIRS